MRIKISYIFYSLFLLIIATMASADTSPSYKQSADNERDAQNKIVVDTDKTGALLRWQSHGRVWVENAPSPFIVVLANGTKAEFVADGVDENTSNSVTVRGYVDTLPARVTYTLNPDGTNLQIALKLDTPKEIESWTCTFPLTLDRHKKIFFQGDHHLPWESRFTYTFHLSTSATLLSSPDFNEWQWFTAEQLSPDAFRIWKSESDTTSPLVMQEGKRMPPYVQVFDEHGGVTVAYPQMAEGGRRALKVDARDHGAVQVTIQAPQPKHAPETPSLNEEQIIHLYAHPTQESLQKKREILNAAFTPSAPVEMELREPLWLRETPLADGIQYVTGGFPFAQGALRNASTLSVQVAGMPVPLQTHPLGFWPDGSLKWVLLTFPFTNAKASESTSTPRVTLRNGEVLPVTIDAATSPEPSQQVEAHILADGQIEVRNGALRFHFNKGEKWLNADLNQKPLFTASPKAYVRFLRDVEKHPPFALRIHGGIEKEEILKVKSLALEESGPLRVVIRLEGEVGDTETTRIILRATIYAGRPEILFTHTAEFRFKDPRTTFLTGMGIEFPLAGLASNEAGIVQETYDFQWTYGGATPHKGGWFSRPLEGNMRFMGGIRHAAQTAPKAITQKGNIIYYELWPTNVSPMDVRRYSNRGHLAQGEAVTDSADWVATKYYPQMPFVGISRTHELILGFWSANQAPKMDILAADFESPPLLYPGWETVLKARVLLPTSSLEGWPKVWENRDHLAQFWLYHQKLHHWYGFWNFGDFRHRFRDGYGWVTTPEKLAAALADPKHQLPADAPKIQDYKPANDWAYDNGRWGWSNSEGLPNFFLQQEYLRTGNRALYFAAEAMARYCRDVVIRHDAPLLGHGTRHGVQPWSDGNHEERQTTSTEFRLHYFLSGDARTRDVVNELYERYYATSSVSNEAAHSGRWGGLLFHQEMTGSPEEADQLTRYAASFIAPDGTGLYLDPHLQFPGPKTIAPAQSLNAERMFFVCYGALHNMLEYQQAFRDEALKEGLLAMARDIIKRPPDSFQTIFMLPFVAFAAQNATDPNPFKRYLLTALRSDRSWPALYQSVSANPEHWSGSTAFLHNNMPGVFFWANWVPYITKSFTHDTIWSKDIEVCVDVLEKQGKEKQKPVDPWLQKNYDALIHANGTYVPHAQ